MVLTSCSVVSVSIGLSLSFFSLLCALRVFFASCLFFLFLEYDCYDIYRLSIYSLYILIKKSSSTPFPQVWVFVVVVKALPYG